MRLVILMAFGWALAACAPLDESEKTSCSTSDDCLAGNDCVDSECVAPVDDDGIWQDATGDVSTTPATGAPPTPDFVDLTGGSFEIDGDTLSWKITVAELPTDLAFNQAAVDDGTLEYQWAVSIDIERDGEDDLELSLSHFKFGAAMEGAAIANTQHGLWRLSDSGGQLIDDIAALASGNTMTLEVERSADQSLAALDASAGMRVTAFFTDGTHNYDDEIVAP